MTPTLITRDMLMGGVIMNMQDLAAKLPAFAHADIAMREWMHLPERKSSAGCNVDSVYVVDSPR